MTATARYELRMMLRKRSMWITMGGAVLLLALISAEQFGQVLRDDDARYVMASMALLLNIFLPAVYGCLLADRLIRDARLGVAPILDATPAPRMARLFGKYLGVCAAITLPVAIVFFAFAVAYTVVSGRYVALAWAVAAFAAILLPAVLFVAAFALAVPLLIPAPLFRILFVGYWFWGNAISPTAMPTLAQSIITPIGDYPLAVFFHFGADTGRLAGPQPGAALNFLRPEPTIVTAYLSIGVLLAIAALVLYGAEAVRARTNR